MKLVRIVALLVAACCLSGCPGSPESARGFRLPDGDAEAGRAAFVALQCHACHQVADVELPSFPGTAPVSVELGGQVSRVKTYGDLVTSIINPSHKLIRRYPEDQVSRDGESLMPVLNDVMTVQQLVDLVAFLQPNYEVVPPLYTYPEYSYPVM